MNNNRYYYIRIILDYIILYYIILYMNYYYYKQSIPISIKSHRLLCTKNLKTIINIKIPNIPINNIYETVFIEFRWLPHSEYLIRNTILKLPKWSHTVVCGNNNYNQIYKMCKQISPNIKIIKLNYNSVTIPIYNTLLLTTKFWNNFKGEKLLIYQEDSFLFHNNIKPFLKYDYIGAPWKLNRNLNIDHIKYGVGNGGFSLRTRKKNDRMYK